jgi:DNA-binding NarL/FixJ family response regulator
MEASFQTNPAYSGNSILIFDRHALTASTIKDILKEELGSRVTVEITEDSCLAKALIEKNKYALVILDCDKNTLLDNSSCGIKILKEMQTKHRTVDYPTFILTTGDVDYTREKLIQLGIPPDRMPILSKPFGYDEMTSEIKHALDYFK